MFLVSLIASILYFVLLLYFFVLWARFIVDLVRTFNRSWRPRGVGLVLIEFVYSVTDPPVRFFRRIIPPLSMGPVAFDFGWSLTMLCCIIAMWITGAFR
ncbi:YggT family protein [Glaciibacter superstes]|uniref:YggT family protein n=1 Tax=Glaciibacter superstes TaxID=501023 RepID=UPI0003B57A73|nr:YggT family protein [Glaciibacter superstes]